MTHWQPGCWVRDGQNLTTLGEILTADPEDHEFVIVCWDDGVYCPAHISTLVEA